MVWGRSKKEIFDNVVNKILKKLSGWKEKLLSRAGKEILLKAVVQAIPTYLMGLYHFPISVIQRLHGLFAQFWWGNKVHWKRWHNLCTLKLCGGLGFRRLDIQALLANHAWRLQVFPNSLAARVTKCKYYPNSNFLDSRLGLNGSYVWRSVWGSKALLVEGLAWRVGDGQSIRVWKDKWIRDEEGEGITTACPEGLNDQLVATLMTNEGQWNDIVIDSTFNQRDAHFIKAIPLSCISRKDSVFWTLSKCGPYSVKSAYQLGTGNFESMPDIPWRKLWSLNMSSSSVGMFYPRFFPPIMSYIDATLLLVQIVLAVFQSLNLVFMLYLRALGLAKYGRMF